MDGFDATTELVAMKAVLMGLVQVLAVERPAVAHALADGLRAGIAGRASPEYVAAIQTWAALIEAGRTTAGRLEEGPARRPL